MKPCNCPRYTWPHRKGGGSCIWNPNSDEEKCLACGQACAGQLKKHWPEDTFAEKVYASNTWIESDCCGAGVVQSGTLATTEELQ